MKILLTGASGFVGSKVARKILKRFGHENIIALSSGKIDFLKCLDSRNYNFDSDYLKNNFPDLSTIFHIGAFIPKSGTEANNIEKSMSNIINTKKLIFACSKLENLKKFIFTSSIDVYGSAKKIINENTPAIPESLYGLSKLFCEKMIQVFCDANKIKCIILRLGHVYGEGEDEYKKVIPVMIKSAINHKVINIFGDGEALRTFIYINDAADAIVNAAELNCDGSEIINVVGNQATSINQIASMIVRLAGSDSRVNYIASEFSNINSVFDNSKQKNLLTQAFTPIETGLLNEIKYFRSHEYNL